MREAYAGGMALEVVRGELPSVLRSEVERLVSVARLADGAGALSDATLLDRSPAAIHVLARVDTPDPLEAPNSPLALHAYGFTNAAAGELAAGELVVAPDARRRGLGGHILDTLLDAGAREFWAHGDTPGAQRLAATRVLTPTRRLLIMFRSAAGLPPQPALPPGYRIRPYDGNADDAALRTVNTAAFVDLPDQGGWTEADFAARFEAPWFDPDGLLILEHDGHVVGFHWTKRHDATTGEVYVMGIAPEHHGRGLGSPLTLAGLHHLAEAGANTLMLYVDAANGPALSTYQRLGFEIGREDALYAAPEQASATR